LAVIARRLLGPDPFNGIHPLESILWDPSTGQPQ
jgi:hypothetical protein